MYEEEIRYVSLKREEKKKTNTMWRWWSRKVQRCSSLVLPVKLRRYFRDTSRKCVCCASLARIVEKVLTLVGRNAVRCGSDCKKEPKSATQDVVTHASPIRFWILGLFSFLAWFQCLQWNLWGPLSQSVASAFDGWGAETVAMMANWGTITFALFVAPMCMVMNSKGLRVGVLLCAALVAAGTVVKIISFTTDSTLFFTIACHIGAFLNGISGTLIMSSPPMIAALWFPPRERTTATAVSQVMNQLGSAGSYLEPLLVHSPADGYSPEEIKSDIKRLLYIYAGIGVAVLLAVLACFPEKPAIPPSITSSVERLNFKSSLKTMIRNKDILMLTLSYSSCIGVPACWLTVLNYSLEDLNMNQDEAMWVGLSSVLAQGLTGLLVGRFTDLVYGHVKISLMCFMITSLSCFYWFYLLTTHSIPVTTAQIYCSVLGGLAANFATAPLFFELAVEIAYPCPEVLVGGLLTGTMNAVGVIFYFLFLIPNIGYRWVTYVLMGSCACALLPLLLTREDYSRSKLDGKKIRTLTLQEEATV